MTFLLSVINGFAQADHVVTNTNYQSVYVVGSTVVYNITVVNMGPQAATNVTVTSVAACGPKLKTEMLYTTVEPTT